MKNESTLNFLNLFLRRADACEAKRVAAKLPHFFANLRVLKMEIRRCIDLV